VGLTLSSSAADKPIGDSKIAAGWVQAAYQRIYHLEVVVNDCSGWVKETFQGYEFNLAFAHVTLKPGTDPVLVSVVLDPQTAWTFLMSRDSLSALQASSYPDARLQWERCK
jgi:hypothetical protein